jgi:lipoprotein-anchoring transpeptidase ErfK/SrfK
LALIAGASLILAACGGSTSGKGSAKTTPTTGSTTSVAPSNSDTPTTAAATKPVHVSLNIGDGGQVGVGLPIIATFKVKVKDGAAFQAATKVTVDGEPAEGAWYFEYSDPASGHLMEAHYRLQHYWPAHAEIHMDLPVKGLSAGTGLAYDNSLTLDFSTGAANIVTVDDATHKLTVVSDGKTWGTFPVSLGATATPTARGYKVIMEKGKSICMSGTPPNGPAYHECGVKYTQRLTYGGEYLHAAPWNLTNISKGVDSSNGCTNLTTADALKLYQFLGIGDVVYYPNANGPKMQLGQGYGDWNLAWPLWKTGGAVSTS